MEIRCKSCGKLLGKVVNGKFEIEKGGICLARVYGFGIVQAECPRCHRSEIIQLLPQSVQTS